MNENVFAELKVVTERMGDVGLAEFTSWGGLTKLEWFAGLAMQGVIAESKRREVHN